MSFVTMDHEATGILLQRTASPTHGLRTKLTAAVCCLSTGHIRVSSERRFENMLYSTSRVSLLAPRMCLMLYGHLSWRNQIVQWHRVLPWKSLATPAGGVIICRQSGLRLNLGRTKYSGSSKSVCCSFSGWFVEGCRQLDVLLCYLLWGLTVPQLVTFITGKTLNKINLSSDPYIGSLPLNILTFTPRQAFPKFYIYELNLEVESYVNIDAISVRVGL